MNTRQSLRVRPHHLMLCGLAVTLSGFALLTVAVGGVLAPILLAGSAIMLWAPWPRMRQASRSAAIVYAMMAVALFIPTAAIAVDTDLRVYALWAIVGIALLFVGGCAAARTN